MSYLNVDLKIILFYPELKKHDVNDPHSIFPTKNKYTIVSKWKFSISKYFKKIITTVTFLLRKPNLPIMNELALSK